MIGPFFAKHLKKNNVQIRKGESLADIVKMYQILLDLRGKTPETASVLDEKIALGAVCKFPVQGKKRHYLADSVMLRARFKGIARDESLQATFRKSVTPGFIGIQVIEDVKMRTLADVFAGLDEFPTAGTEPIETVETGLAA